MIKSIKLYNLRNSENSQLMTDILGIVTKNDPAALQGRDICLTLQTLVENMKNLFKECQGSLITDELFKLNAFRNEAFNGISIVVNGYIYHHNPLLKNHPLALQIRQIKYTKQVKLLLKPSRAQENIYLKRLNQFIEGQIIYGKFSVPSKGNFTR